MSDPMNDQPVPEKKTAEERQTERLNALPWQPWQPGDLAMPSFASPLEPLFQEGGEEPDDGQPKVQVDQNELLNCNAALNSKVSARSMPVRNRVMPPDFSPAGSRATAGSYWKVSNSRPLHAQCSNWWPSSSKRSTRSTA